MASFVDANILLYAISMDTAERAKSERAIDILRRDDLILSAQVLNEFIARAMRPGGAALALDEVMAFVGVWRRFPIVPIDMALIDAATDVTRRTNYSWWDSLIVAAAIRSGCDRLLSEDMQHGRVIDGVRIENPFRELA